MVSSVFGIAVIALPSGIITAGFMEQILHQKDEDNKPDHGSAGEYKDMSFNHRTPDIRLSDPGEMEAGSGSDPT
jgi:hypothetical protein